jgi:hypothetical protein
VVKGWARLATTCDGRLFAVHVTRGLRGGDVILLHDADRYSAPGLLAADGRSAPPRSRGDRVPAPSGQGIAKSSLAARVTPDPYAERALVGFEGLSARHCASESPGAAAAALAPQFGLEAPP